MILLFNFGKLVITDCNLQSSDKIRFCVFQEEGLVFPSESRPSVAFNANTQKSTAKG